MTIQNPKQIPSVKAGVNIFLLNLIECPICNGNCKLRNDIDDATPRGLTCTCNPYILMGIESVKALYFVREEMPRQSVEVLANEGELQPRAMMNKNWNYRWCTAHFWNKPVKKSWFGSTTAFFGSYDFFAGYVRECSMAKACQRSVLGKLRTG